MAKTYAEKLRDPRWQKKRLEIMQRDDFACQWCGDKESTLNIHHKRYLSGKNPWEYENDLLVTYCQYCHSIVEDNKKYGRTLSVIRRFKDDDGKFNSSAFSLDDKNCFAFYTIQNGNPICDLYISKESLKKISEL